MTSAPGGSARCSRTGRPLRVSKGGAASARAARGRLHGGGYELGSLRSDGELAARLGRASGMRVLFPEYRLAPEHPFPAAIDDVLAAWRWLRTGQGLSAASMAVAGDSAGGGGPTLERPWRRRCSHRYPGSRRSSSK
jgi:alpha/beta hydrolase fold